jgi:hypothetical protein
MLSDFEKVYYDRLLEQIRNKNRVLFCFFKRKNPITMADLAQLKDSVDYVLYGPAKSYEDEKLTEKTDVKAEWISDIVQRNELRKQKLCQRASDCSEERLNFGI